MVTKKSLMYTGVCIMCLCFVWFTKQLGVYLQTLDKHCIMTFTKIPPVENELFHADGHYESGSRFSQRFKTSWKGNTDFMFISSTCIAVSGIIEKKNSLTVTLNPFIEMSRFKPLVLFCVSHLIPLSPNFFFYVWAVVALWDYHPTFPRGLPTAFCISQSSTPNYCIT